jgi:hypothetical protein
MFNKPCIECGVLSRAATCRSCHLKKEQARNRIRDNDPARKLKKATLYDSNYKRKAMLLKSRGGTCYLCGRLVPPGTGQADHVYPSDPTSPLAITHAFCNQSKGNKTIKPNQPG